MKSQFLPWSFLLSVVTCHAGLRACSNLSEIITSVVHNSPIIFTGKILSLKNMSELSPTVNSNPNYHPYNFTQKARGLRISGLNPARKTSKERKWEAKVLIKVLFKGSLRDMEGKVIHVIIFETNDSPCNLRRLRAFDTRIFFYHFEEEKMKHEFWQNETNTLRTKDWKQTLLPLPPTLRVLTALTQAINGEKCIT